jgi:hypothetical protein
MADPTRRWVLAGANLCEEASVNWQGPNGVAEDDTEIQWRVRGTSTWQTATGSSHLHPFTGDESTEGRPARLIHRVRFTGLDPGQEIEFRIDPVASPVRYFRTFPETLAERDVRIVIGADVYQGQITPFRNLLTQVRGLDVDAILINGDLAYSDSVESRFGREDTYWTEFTTGLEMPDGRVIMKLATLGNHEVLGGYSPNGWPDARYFAASFDYPSDRSWQAHDAGAYLSIAALDSEHLAGVVNGTDAQTLWLDDWIEATAGFPFRYPCFHITPYTTYNAFGSVEASSRPKRLRVHWCSRFEDAGIKQYFAGHDHTYLRTHAIKGEQLDPDGSYCVGNGAFGLNPRPLAQAGAWYIAEAYGSENTPWARHFNLLTLTADGQTREDIASDGTILHTYYEGSITPPPPPPPPPGERHVWTGDALVPHRERLWTGSDLVDVRREVAT